MTVNDLKRYRKLDAEINALEEEIIELKNNQMVDVVKISDSNFPFTEHSYKICGNNSTILDSITEKRCEKAELEALKTEIEQFIDTIADNITRKIFRYKYIKGATWAEVAKAVKGNNTRDSVRKAAKRYLKKICIKN